MDGEVSEQEWDEIETRIMDGEITSGDTAPQDDHPVARACAAIREDGSWTPWRLQVISDALRSRDPEDLREIYENVYRFRHEDDCARRLHSAGPCTCIIGRIFEALIDARYEV